MTSATSSTRSSHGNLPAVSYHQAAEISERASRQLRSVVGADLPGESCSTRCSYRPFWRDTAVIINYDDSDGWYDHVAGPIVNHSTNLGRDRHPVNPNIGGDNNADNANDSLIPVLAALDLHDPRETRQHHDFGLCGPAPADAPPGAGRCGYGPRLPFIVISPWAKQISSTTPSPTRPPACGSSRKIGTSALSTARHFHRASLWDRFPSTNSPDRSSICSTLTTSRI